MVVTDGTQITSAEPQPQKLPDRWDLLSKRLLWVYRARTAGHHLSRRPGRQSAVLVLEGSLEITFDQKPIRTKAGQWLIGPSRPFRIQSVAPDSVFLSVGWEAEWPNLQPLFDAGLPLVLSRKQGAALEAATEQLFQSVHGSSRSVVWDQAVRHSHESLDQLLEEEAAFATWLRQLARTLKTHGISTSRSPNLDQRVRQLLHLLGEYPANKPLNTAQLARQTGLGWRRLKDLFQEEMSLTPHEYLDQRRFREVSERLRSGEEAPKNIAYSLGFKHLSHFSAWFRKHEGRSPRQFVKDGVSVN